MTKQDHHKRKYSSGKTAEINKGFTKVKGRFNKVKKNFESYDRLIDRAEKSKDKNFKADVIHFFDDDGDLSAEYYKNPNRTLNGLKRSSQQVGGPLSSNPRPKWQTPEEIRKEHFGKLSDEEIEDTMKLRIKGEIKKLDKNNSSSPRVKNKFGDDIGSLSGFTKKEQRILRNREKRGEVFIGGKDDGKEEERAIKQSENIPDEHYDEGYYYGDEE